MTDIEQIIEAAQDLEAQGDLDRALEYWRSVLGLKRDALLLCRFGRVAMRAGLLEEARRAFLEAVDLAPALPYAYECLGMLYSETDSHEAAIAAFLKALSLEQTAPLYTLLGAEQLGQGRVADARGSLGEALRIDPDYEEALYNLGMSYSLEEPAKAAPLLLRAVEIDPGYAVAHCELGWLYRRLGRYAEAEFHLRRSIELDPADGQAYIYLGNVLWSKSELNEAEHSFRKAVEVWPESSLAHWSVALFYEHQGRNAEADFHYEYALKLDPDSPEAHFRFGSFLRKVADPTGAKIHLHRALELDPDLEDAKLALAEIETTQPDPEQE